MRTIRTLLSLGMLHAALHGTAQSPNAFSYQAVARDQVTGNVLAGFATTGEFALRNALPLGTVIFAEHHAILTDDRGLFTVQIGTGTPLVGNFDAIDWRNGPFYLEVSLDLSGTGTFTSMGTQQLLSVPFALHAQSSSDVPQGTETGQIAHWDGTTWVVDSGLYVHQRRFGIGDSQPEAPLGITASPSGRIAAIKLRGDLPPLTRSYSISGAGANGNALGFNEVVNDSTRSRLVIQEGTGHLGIGSDDPPAPLSIESREVLKTYFQTGDIPTQNDFAFTSDSIGFGIGQGLPNALSSRLFIDRSSQGNVGIGTTTPAERFHVHAVHNGHSVGMRVSNGAVTTNNGWVLGHLHDEVTPVRSGAFTLSEAPGSGGGSGGTRLTVLPGGNLGVNEVMPFATLHVTKPTSDPTEPVSLSENTGIAMFGPLEQHLVLDSRGIQSRILLAGGTSLTGSAGNLSLQPLGGKVIVHNNATEESRKFIIADNGNVGIGTPMPDAPLHVVSRDHLITRFETGDIPTQDDMRITTQNGTGFSIDDATSGTSLSRIFIQPQSGNVGVNTVEPSEKLHVNGAIVIGNSEQSDPPNGTIRWNGTDLEGRKDGAWSSLTAGAIEHWQVAPAGGIEFSPPTGGSKVSVGLPAPSSTVRIDSWAAITERSTGALIRNTTTTTSTDPADHRVGLEIANSGIWGGAPDSKDIGLYVSEVSGQSGASSNLAAVLNGNVVIGNVQEAVQEVGHDGRNVLVLQNGAAPSTASGSGSGLPDGGIQLYSASNAMGASTFHVMNGDGTVIKLSRAPDMTAPDNTPLGPGVDPATAALIENMRTRINELEAILKSIGFVAP